MKFGYKLERIETRWYVVSKALKHLWHEITRPLSIILVKTDAPNERVIITKL